MRRIRDSIIVGRIGRHIIMRRAQSVRLDVDGCGRHRDYGDRERLRGGGGCGGWRRLTFRPRSSVFVSRASEIKIQHWKLTGKIETKGSAITEKRKMPDIYFSSMILRIGRTKARLSARINE